jgi:hypothetical protein
MPSIRKTKSVFTPDLFLSPVSVSLSKLIIPFPVCRERWEHCQQTGHVLGADGVVRDVAAVWMPTAARQLISGWVWGNYGDWDRV